MVSFRKLKIAAPLTLAAVAAPLLSGICRSHLTALRGDDHPRQSTPPPSGAKYLLYAK